jgi:formate/nitrite transporter FocA (FNT family)
VTGALLAAAGVGIAVAVGRGSYENLTIAESVLATAGGVVGGAVYFGLIHLCLKGWDRLRCR